MKKSAFILSTLLVLCNICLGQQHEEDSIFIQAYETHEKIVKVLHAEPLFIDLIRDLGARKGEREWNFAGGFTDNTDLNIFEYLVEYEWAVKNRLGLEFEIPAFSLTANEGTLPDSIYKNSIESFKAAIQWSFFVNQKISSSFALGYINELVVGEPGVVKRDQFIWANIFNPFLVMAKRWGTNFHTLIYTGPKWLYEFEDGHTEFGWEINYNLHYMVPTTDNFVGLEINQFVEHGHSSVVFRPQMRLDIAPKWMAGLVVGIPSNIKDERLSFFIRLIYEPSEFDDE